MHEHPTFKNFGQMKKIIFILALNAVFFIVNGQSTIPGGYTKGYILTKTDTMHCYVLSTNHFYNCTSVNYKLSKEDKRQTMYIDDIVEIYDNSDFYRKITYNTKSLLVIRRIKGPVCLYELNNSYEANRDFSSNGRTVVSGGTYMVENSIFYLEKGDILVRIDKRSFKEDVKKVLSDDPGTLKKIDDSMKKYKDVSVYIESFVNNYNTWLGSQKK